jgi:hypothetical protein
MLGSRPSNANSEAGPKAYAGVTRVKLPSLIDLNRAAAGLTRESLSTAATRWPCHALSSTAMTISNMSIPSSSDHTGTLSMRRVFPSRTAARILMGSDADFTGIRVSAFRAVK